MYYPIFAAVLLCIASSAGGFLSFQYRHAPGQWSPLWLYGTSVLSTSAWLLLCRSPYKLSNAAVAFDVTAAGLYLVAFVCLGERLSVIQATGAVVALLGLALMSS